MTQADCGHSLPAPASLAAIADAQAIDLRPNAFFAGEKSASAPFEPRGWINKLPVPSSHVLSVKSDTYCAGKARERDMLSHRDALNVVRTS